MPEGRWKTVYDVLPGGGVVMFGGDVNNKQALNGGYLNDLWLVIAFDLFKK
jgi:hypothetical protein